MSTFFGLDIGSSSIKLVQLSGKTVQFGAVVTNPTGKVGVDLTPMEQGTLLASVKSLIASSKLKTKRVVISVPESLVFTRVMKFPVMSSPELATAIRWEAEQLIPYPVDKLEFSWIILYKPRNAMSGEKMSVLVVAVPTKISHAYVNFMDLLGLEVLRVENEAVSLVRSLITVKKLPGVSMVADLGFSNSKFVVADSNQIYTSYLSSLGGMAITRMIADAFKLPINQAEEYKRTYGLDKQQFEGKLFAAMEPILSGVIADIRKVASSYQANYPDKRLDRVILTGGGAYMKGLAPFVAEQTGMETIVGDSFDGFKIESVLTGLGPVYASAMGLAIEEI